MTENQREYWHAIVTPTLKKRQEGWTETVIIDKDRDWMEQRILGPRRLGTPITLRGRTFDWPDVEQLKITVSEHSATDWYPRIEQEWRQSSVSLLSWSIRSRELPAARLLGQSGTCWGIW